MRAGHIFLRLLALGLLPPLLTAATGCNWISAMTYYFQPPRKQPAEYQLTKERVAVVVDYAKGVAENPGFLRAMHDKVVEQFRNHDVNDHIVSFDEYVRLRQANSDYPSWSIARIGRELNASQVLYVRIELFQLQESPGHPVVTPRAAGEVRVIDANAPKDAARLWPAKLQRREFKSSLPPEEASDSSVIDAAAIKLGHEVGRAVAAFFYDVDLEAPKERD